MTCRNKILFLFLGDVVFRVNTHLRNIASQSDKNERSSVVTVQIVRGLTTFSKDLYNKLETIFQMRKIRKPVGFFLRNSRSNL